MNIFVLSTGRAGSKTFAWACQHLTNFTARHELRAHQIGPIRFAFPDNHIEVDNRLSWHLGLLARHYDDKDVFYVHLKRDAEKTAQSFLRRWSASTFRASIIHAFAHGVVMKGNDWEESERIEVCRYYVDTINANIEDFVKNRPHMTVHLEDGGVSFEAFLDRIQAQGDVEKCKTEWTIVRNAGR
ncbi:MAG: hypothetical protein ACPGTU_11310 [Myxococcota bacterium]